jgi:4-hydroxy-3-methylbut-2-enyl diphosphate reductase
MPAYFIKDESEIKSKNEIHHFDYASQKLLEKKDWLPQKDKISIVLTSGASCPDAVVEAVMEKLLSYFDLNKTLEEVMQEVG